MTSLAICGGFEGRSWIRHCPNCSISDSDQTGRLGCGVLGIAAGGASPVAGGGLAQGRRYRDRDSGLDYDYDYDYENEYEYVGDGGGQNWK